MTRLGLGLALAALAAGCAPMSLDPFLYAPEPAQSYDLPTDVIPAHEDLFYPTPDGETLHAAFIPSSGSRPDVTLLYFHGQSNNVGSSWHRVEYLYPLGFNIAVFDGRGYGLSTGSPDEEGLRTDLRAFHDVLRARPDVTGTDLVYYGRSLGGAFAIDLSTDHPPALLVTESTFTSVAAMVEDGAYVDLPRSFVAESRWDSLAKIPGVTAPYLALHGERDDYVQPRYSRELTDAHAGEGRLALVPDADHGDVPERMGLDAYRAQISGALP